MKIIGISGMPGSGKSFVSEIAISKGAKIVSMGDVIREEAKKRGQNTQTTAVMLRREFGDYIVGELTIAKIKKMKNEKLIVVEGIRSPYEVKLFKENFPGFELLSIFANPDTRFKRLKKRNREDDSTSFDEFLKRDNRELNFGIGEVIAESDKLFVNENDLDLYKNKINNYLNKIIS